MKISIVTPVYNRQNCIEDCIKSVINQSYSDIEHIIIDGKSTDGSKAIIESYKNRLGYYISEKDNGIYDALNKGIKKATGDIIGILHSDDLFFCPNSLSQVAEAFTFSGADIVYADGLYVDREKTEQIKRIYPSVPFQKKFLTYGWIPLHTTIFVKREIFEKYGLYNSSYSIASDYDISLRWFNNENIKKYYLKEWLVRMRLGGCSTSPKLQWQKSKQDLEIIRQHKLKGLFTLACKIGRKIPQYIIPHVTRFQPH